MFEAEIVNFGIYFEVLQTSGFAPMLDLQLSWLKWMKLNPLSTEKLPGICQVRPDIYNFSPKNRKQSTEIFTVL